MALITGNENDNFLPGTADSDRIRGLGGNDRIEGRVGNDTLEGGNGRDTIYGGRGRDILIGGLGRDFMYGGDGNDTYRFDDRDAGDATAGLSDVIRDFSSGDVLDLIDLDVGYFAGNTADPGVGGFSIWHARGNTYVTWNTFGTFHDIELTGFSGDPLSQIRWYRDDYLGDVNTTGSIASGQTKTGTIEVGEDTDWFRISISQDRVYTIDVYGEDLLAYPAVYDANGDRIGGNHDLSRFILPTGTYYVEVSDYEQYYTGTYQLSVSSIYRPIPVDDYAGNASTAGRIAAGQTRDGDIGAPGDHDWFRIRLTEGETYAISLRGATSGSGTLIDPYVVLHDARGYEIAADDDGSGTLDSLLVFTADATGNYYIDAGELHQQWGTYELGVELVDPPLI